MTDPITIIINGSQSIPLTVTTITKTNWTQYILSFVIAGFALLYFIGSYAGNWISKGIGKILIKFFKRSNKIKHLMVIKHTNSGLFNMSMINQDTMKDIQEAMIKFNGEDFDLILYTIGGEIFSSEFISRLFKNYKGKIRTFVPVYSMSGGTYLALSTDEIYMNDYSCLGGIDPQLGSLFSYGSAKGWNEVLKVKKNKANDQSIIMNMMGKQYTKTMKENISNLLIDKIPNNIQRKEFVNYLTLGDIQHALPLTKNILRTYGLNIKDIDPETNKRLLHLLKRINDGVTYG